MTEYFAETPDIQNDGWVEHSDYQQIQDEPEKEYYRYRGEKGLSILQSKHHSLQPDMISGWRPKLPSCPLPITYKNQYVDSLMNHMLTEDRFTVAYVGARYMNSVQINQKYNYFWRYRQRYSLNLAIIKEAIKNVGGEAFCRLGAIQQSIPVPRNTHSFDSCFQSGNLDLAIKVKKDQYDCFIRSDTNTKGHTNWYYFKVNNNNQVGPMKINICNMAKTRNLYSKGMKPYTRIVQKQNNTSQKSINSTDRTSKTNKKCIWSQDHCYDVIFVERYCRYGFDKKTYQLQFTFNFTEPDQEVYFAYGIPYTYSDLENFIKQIKESHPTIVHSRKLCQSLGGLQLPLLTITNPDINNNGIENIQNNQPSINYKKKAVVVTARIHPGESNSSHVLQGFVRSLLQQSQSSENLKNLFIFYIVPMLNPDGVVAGNFRTSYSGKDLNRQFNNLNKYIYPEVYHLAQFCQTLKRSFHRTIDFYFDFHGHSAKKNLFCYGPQHPTTKVFFFKSRALAKLIERASPIFSYRKSIFTISQSKKNTGRAYMLKNLKIPMTFTFQISNGIYENDKKINVLLNEKTLHEAGRIVVQGLYKYSRLEMKIPKKAIKAKVDTNKASNYTYKRSLNSAGNKRRDSLQVLKKRSAQQIAELKLSKGKSVKKSTSLQKTQNLQQNKQFIALMKQIKKQNQVCQQIQGGSDSEGSEDDLSKEQTNQLFGQIMKRNNQNSYNIKKNKTKPAKMLFKKQQTPQEQQVVQQPKQEQRKHISSRILQISKPPISTKNIRRGVSYQYDKVAVAQKNFTMLI